MLLLFNIKIDILFQEGKNYGDEYLAELDYIEVIERIKEDYEESVPEELMSEAEKSAGSCKYTFKCIIPLKIVIFK